MSITLDDVAEYIRNNLAVETIVEFGPYYDYGSSDGAKRVKVTVNLSLDGETISSSSDYASG